MLYRSNTAIYQYKIAVVLNTSHSIASARDLHREEPVFPFFLLYGGYGFDSVKRYRFKGNSCIPIIGSFSGNPIKTKRLRLTVKIW